MNASDSEKPKIIVDEDWKNQVQAERDAVAKPQAGADEGSTAKPEDFPIPEATFSVLVTTLATQAIVALGQTPMPDEDKVVVNLRFAQHCIDTLNILAQKTKGNLTTAEDRLLSRFLHELRMLYVSVQNQLKDQLKNPLKDPLKTHTSTTEQGG
jgi:hypothetical protein